MRLKEAFRKAGCAWSTLTVYSRFEHAIVLVLTVLIAVVVASGTWHLAIAIASLVFSGAFDPTNPVEFQRIFGMIVIVMIALEFEHSLLVVLARQESIIRLRTVLVIAMLAVVRRFIIIDVNAVATDELLALAAAILALGIVHWLVRDQDRRNETSTGSA
ncbi:MAG TPA: phosphate-starvation-inducible PsiE family protein [Alphaproteobacteria bacterium]|nr:phosphate-starvation-inducible PsiE family protein [Alphaproteobacteria bacterium]